jgi:N-acetylmuramoyl-L-alanine amidase
MTKYENYKIFLTFLFIPFFFLPSLSYPKDSSPARQMVVIIDPGHGGKDPGAVSGGIQEKDAVLAIGLKLGKLIRDNFPDVKVIFTRSTDVFVPLIERSRIANKSKASLFISLHANFCGTPSISGTETYVLGLHRSNENLEVAKKENSVILLEDNYKKTYQGFDPNLSESYIMFELAQDVYMDQSLAFADHIQQQFNSKLSGSNRGVKQAGFLVLRESSMPSVLVETGFISNPNEARYLMSEAGQSNIAHSIFEAFKKFKGKNGVPVQPVLAGEIKPEEKNGVTDRKGHPDNKAENPDSVNKKVTEPAIVPTVPDPETVVGPANSPAPETEVSKNKTATAGSENQSASSYYSVQIAASTTAVDPVPGNFKGLKNVRREKSDKYYRYFVGRENSLREIIPTLEQVKKRFPGAFVVSFKNGVRSIIDPVN